MVTESSSGVGTPLTPPWESYRKRCRAFRWSFLLAALWLVPGSLIRRALVRRGFDDGAAFLCAVAVPALGVIAIAHLRRVLWRCPRCRLPFHVTWWRGDPFGRQCVHCGLPVGAEPSDYAA